MASKPELACVYSALILVDDDVAITVSEIKIKFIFFCDSCVKVTAIGLEILWKEIGKNCTVL